MFSPYGPDKISGIQNTDFVQAVEEFIRAIKQYKNICESAIKISMPDHVQESLEQLFKIGSWINEPWFPLEDKWEEYKKQNGITDK